MVKKNWRDTGSARGPQVPGRRETTSAAPVSGAFKVLVLLAAAGLLGGLIALYLRLIPPERSTPLVWAESFPGSLGRQVLSTNPFATEVKSRMAAANGDFVTIPGNLNDMGSLTITAAGPGQNVVLFYLYADLFLDAQGNPVLLTDGTAIDAGSNRPLDEVLESLCRLSIDSPSSQPTERVVVLDFGRLDPTEYGRLRPQPLASAIQRTVQGLAAANVPHAENLWVLLSHDDFQQGWAAPELNGSVFAHFLAMGLQGHADAGSGDLIVTLDELSSYVAQSVARWTMDYRDAIQTPRLIAGSREGKPEDVQLVHVDQQAPDPVLSPLQPNLKHDELWAQAFGIPQPHARQRVTTLLMRLEQLRFGQSLEYEHVRNEALAILAAASESEAAPGGGSPSVFDSLSESQRKGLSDPALLKELALYLEVDSGPPAPAPQEPPADPADGTAEPESAEPPAPGKTLDPTLKRLTPAQRLALVWHHVVHQLPPDVDVESPQLRQAVGFIRRQNPAEASCDGFVEMQFLDLLLENLPLDHPQFDPRLTRGLILDQDHALQQLAGRQSSLSSFENPAGSTAGDPVELWRQRRHLEPMLERLQQQRRQVLDLALGARFEQAWEALESLAAGRRTYDQRSDLLLKARRRSNQMRFVMPYLRTFVLHEAIYRWRSGQADQAEADPVWAIEPRSLVALENASARILGLLAGPALAETDALQTDVERIDQIVPQVSQRLRQIAAESQERQSAAQYVFVAQQLLESPLPEWLDQQAGQALGSTRQELLNRYLEQLQEQAEISYAGGWDLKADERPPIDQLATNHREQAVRKFADVEPWLQQLVNPESLLTELEPLETWGQLQQAVPRVARLDQLRTPAGVEQLAFASLAEVRAEIQRLDRIDQAIRTSGPVLGLIEELIDIDQQLRRMIRFEGECQLARNSLRDFWGRGEVNRQGTRPPPFLRQLTIYLDNAQALARSVGPESDSRFKLNGQRYVPYDADSLERLVEQSRKLAQQAWQAVTPLQPQWGHNGQPVPVGLSTLQVDGAESNQLALDLPQLSSALVQAGVLEEADVPLTLAQRIEFDEGQYYGDLPVNTSGKAYGQIDFRGHRFGSDLLVARTVKQEIPPLIATARPRYQPPAESQIRVINDAGNDADLLFLIDCSGTMETGGRLDTVKKTTEVIMRELIRDRRFHLGLAAFGHRGKYTNERDSEGRMVVRDGKYPVVGEHPFVDWELLARPPAELSDGAQVDQLVKFGLAPLKPLGLTPLYYSISRSLAVLNHPTRKQMLIVITDGQNNQVPLQNDPAAIPDDDQGNLMRETTLEDLRTEYRRKYADRVEVLVIQIDPDQVNQVPEEFEAVTLGKDTNQELQQKIYDAVGRFQFSVTPVGESPREDDYRRMGETVFLKPKPGSEFEIRTHGVDHPGSSKVVLEGGESYTYVYNEAGLQLETRSAAAAVSRFLRPRIEDNLTLFGEPYRIGRLQSNQFDNVRIGLANRRGLSRYPARVWARVRDSEGREFDMAHPQREFTQVPTFNFQLPDGLNVGQVDMTLFIRDQVAPVEPLRLGGQAQGEVAGIRYQVALRADSSNRFQVTLSNPEGISSPFQLSCPASVPLEGRTRFLRTIRFEGNRRVEEVFEFEVPAGQEPEFELVVLPAEQREAAMPFWEGPVVAEGKDPIFGDEVIAVRFRDVEIRN